MLATAVVLAAVLAGTFWGHDDHFPVGPFRMYSVSNQVDGSIATVTFVGVTRSGEPMEMRPELFGLRPAEVEGQLPRLVGDPEVLAGLVDAYERLQEETEPLRVLRLVEEAHLLENGRPVSTERTTLAEWKSSS